MIPVLLDTSFLISFADPDRPRHQVAVQYFRYCLENRFPMYLSTIAAGEFAVKQSVEDLPLSNFLILPYNLAHDILAAKFISELLTSSKGEKGERAIIINDMKLLAQAEVEGISIILSEDKNTFFKKANQLREGHKSKAEVILLSEGFTPGRLNNPSQRELLL